MKSDKVGTLYLIPISIGEVPADYYQPRHNVDIISGLSTYVVENAKTARRYIKSVCPDRDISELTILEIDKHDAYAFPPQALQLLREGQDMGLMSEAGCPAVADPGSNLVAEAHRIGARVVPLVGPSSILLSLMASGFNGQSFSFHGYIPFDAQRRKELFGEFVKRSNRGETQIFIEAPYRNDKLIDELLRILPSEFRLCVACDLTTEREEIISRSVASWKVTDRPSFHKRPCIFLISN